MNEKNNSMDAIGTSKEERTLAIINSFEKRYSQLFNIRVGSVPSDPRVTAQWLSDLVKRSREARALQIGEPYLPPVEAMRELLNINTELEGAVDGMIKEGLEVWKHYGEKADPDYAIRTITDMLDCLNTIIQEAPIFAPETSHSAFPMSGLFVYMMYTEFGWYVFRDKEFNDSLRGVLKYWCHYLDSTASLNVITTDPQGWLSPASYIKNNLKEFVTEEDQKLPHWGFTSYNDFFHRQILLEYRPLSGPNDESIVVSANDGTAYQLARNVQLGSEFNLKNNTYSLKHILDNSPLTDSYIGGDVFQSFLSGNDYHRWRAPISGTVVEARVVNGYMFSELQDTFDPDAGPLSQGYQANVNTRGLVFIESDDPTLGIVCVIPIGITEISSVEIQVNAGDRVEKGDEIGWFSYGGSSMCLVFQPGAISKFTLPDMPLKPDPDSQQKIQVRAEIAIANVV